VVTNPGIIRADLRYPGESHLNESAYACSGRDLHGFYEKSACPALDFPDVDWLP